MTIFIITNRNKIAICPLHFLNYNLQPEVAKPKIPSVLLFYSTTTIDNKTRITQ